MLISFHVVYIYVYLYFDLFVPGNIVDCHLEINRMFLFLKEIVDLMELYLLFVIIFLFAHVCYPRGVKYMWCGLKCFTSELFSWLLRCLCVCIVSLSVFGVYTLHFTVLDWMVAKIEVSAYICPFLVKNIAPVIVSRTYCFLRLLHTSYKVDYISWRAAEAVSDGICFSSPCWSEYLWAIQMLTCAAFSMFTGSDCCVSKFSWEEIRQMNVGKFWGSWQRCPRVDQVMVLLEL